jgi:putative ABC transport system substrate-binding protein
MLGRNVHLREGQAKPAEMPLQQSTKATLVINLKTPKALRIRVPALLGRADRVIE